MGTVCSEPVRQSQLEGLRKGVECRRVSTSNGFIEFDLVRMMLGPFYDLDITSEDSKYYDQRFENLVDALLNEHQKELEDDLSNFNNCKIDRKTLRKAILNNPKILSKILSIIRRKGIKQNYRWMIWRSLASLEESPTLTQPQDPTKVSRHKNSESSAQTSDEKSSQSFDFRLSNAQTMKMYSECLERVSPEDEETIPKDVMRTFRERAAFSEAEGPGLAVLSRVCRAVGAFYPRMGYVQGMNFIIGFVLEVSGFAEEESWLFVVSLFRKKKNLFFALFEPQFPLVYFQIHVFWTLLSQTKPRLSEILKRISASNDMWLFKWFVTLFSLCLSKEFLLRTWDYIIVGDLFSPVFIALVMVRLMKKFLQNAKTADFLEVVRTPELLCSHFKLYPFMKKLKVYTLSPQTKVKLINDFESIAKKEGIECEYLIDTMRMYFSQKDQSSEFEIAGDYETLETHLEKEVEAVSTFEERLQAETAEN